MAASITSAMRTQVSQLYVSLFGRAPDGEGLGFWAGALAGGKSISTVAQEMFDSTPARAYYPSFLTNQEIVEKFYINVLGRTADADGLAFWLKAMNATGATKGGVIASMIDAVNSYSGSDAAGIASKALFVNKVAVAEYYGLQNLAVGSSTILAGVTSAASSVDTAKAAILNPTVAGQTFTLTTGVNSFTGGTGNDTFDASTSNSLSNGDVLTGGTGTDTLTAVLATSTTKVNSTGVEVFNITSTGGSTLDMTSAAGVTTINSVGTTGNLTLNSLGSVGTVGVNTNTATTTLNYTTAALAGTSDNLVLNVDGVSASSNVTLGLATGATGKVEKVTVNSGSVANTLTTLSTTAAGTTTLAITGDTALTITTALDTEITTVDGSADTGGFSVAVGYTKGATVTGGTGADSITAGTGNDSLTGGGGNDKFYFGTSNTLTSSDAISGGDGTTDSLNFTVASTVADSAFTKVTGVEVVTTSSAATIGLTLGALATAAGVNTVTLAATSAAADSVTVGAGFTNNLTVNLDSDETYGNTVNAQYYTGVLTVKSNLANLNNASALQTITGGTGSDVLAISLVTAADGTAQTSITKIETFTVTDGDTTTDVAGTVTLADANAVGTATVKSTITVDASALTTDTVTIDAVLENDAQVSILGGAGNDTIIASTNTVWGDSLAGNNGNDTFKFSNGNLTADDTVTGGAGSNSIKFTDDTTVLDAVFANVTGVTTLSGNGAATGINATLGAVASAAGITTVTFTDTGATSDTIVVGSGFTNALTVNLDSDVAAGNSVVATAYTGVLTVKTDLANLDATNPYLQTITGGTGSDILQISLVAAATGVAQTAVTKVETFQVIDGDTATDVAGTVLLGNENATFTSVLSYETITVDASALTTDTITINASAEQDAKVVITAGGGADTIVGSASANFGDNLTGGDGNDTFKFANNGLTSADTVSGGNGSDQINFSSDATVLDAAFTNVSSVSKLTGDNATVGVTVTLGALAAAAGITTVTFTDTLGATDSVTVGSGFTSNLTVNLDDGWSYGNTVSATGYTGVLTVAAADTVFNDDNAPTITGGSGSDILSITTSGATITDTNLASVTKVETFKTVGTTSGVTLTLSDNNAAFTSTSVYDTITVDASSLTTGVATISAANESNGKVVIIGGGADDVITASASTNFGDSLVGGAGNDTFKISTAGFTSADTISGDAGDDTIEMSNASTVVDADFTNVTSVKTLSSASDANITATLGALASAAGLTAITSGTGTNVYTVGSGYTGALTIALVAGTDKVVATGNTTGVTVTAAEASITSGDTLTGGTGADTLKVTVAAGGSSALSATEMANVTLFDTIQTVGNAGAFSLTTAAANVAAGATLAVNATSMTSTAFTFDGTAENSATTSGNFNITASGTGAHSITLGSGNDTYTSTSTGADSVVATAGQNTISTGYGNDVITGGTGNDNIDGGEGNDSFVFATLNLDLSDTVKGGAGTTDTVKMSDDATVIDSDFTNFTGVEVLTGSAAGKQLTATLGAAAAAAGITTVTFVDTAEGTDSLTVGSGFTNALTVNLDTNGGVTYTNSVIATGYTGVLTINAADTSLDTAVATLTGGSGSDILNITVSGGTTTATESASISAIETFKTVADAGAYDITLSEGNVTTGNTLTFDATSMATSALTFSGGTQTDGGVVSVSTAGTGDHRITLAAGADTYVGTGSGATSVTAGAGADTVTTGSGNDSVLGGAGNDTIIGGVGNDSITGGAGADSLTGGLGNDIFVYTTVTTDGVTTGVADSNTAGFDSITDWTTAADKLEVTLNYSSLSTAVTVNAQATGAGVAGVTAVQDTLSGERGQWVYDTTASALYINVNNDNLITTSDFKIGLNAAATAANTVAEGDINFVITGTAGNDTITAGSGADSITTSGGDDSITGNSGNDTIDGGTGADVILGGSGDDAITAGTGADTITGGTGADAIVLGSEASTADTVIVGSGDSTTTITVTSSTARGVAAATYDTVSGFQIAGVDILDLFGSVVIAASSAGTNGTDSTAALTSGSPGTDVVKSHAIGNGATAGVITFDDANSFSSAETLGDAGDVAAAIQYLTLNDLGNAGVTVLFTGNSNTYVYQQITTDNGSTGGFTVVELTGVSGLLLMSSGTTTGGVLIA